MAPDHRHGPARGRGCFPDVCAAQQLEISFCNEEGGVVTGQNVGVRMCVLHVGVCAACGWVCAHVYAFGGCSACVCLAYMCACVCKYVFMCVYLCLHVCACLCACVDMRVGMCVCVCVQCLAGAAAPGERRLLHPACFILETSATGSSPEHFHLFCVDKCPKWD